MRVVADTRSLVFRPHNEGGANANEVTFPLPASADARLSVR